MADLKKVAFFHGKAANIAAQIEAGNIKAGNFVVGSDDNTLYYIDESLAAQPLGKQRLFVVDELPQEGQEQGVLYIDTTGRKGYVWDGTQFKAVFEQVDDLSGTLGTIQETLGTLTGTGDGSVQKTVQDAILAAGHLKRVAVDELPDSADANPDYIYMVRHNGGLDNQHFEEFMFIEGKFEKIGDTDTKQDLSDYATKEEVTKTVKEMVDGSLTITEF